MNPTRSILKELEGSRKNILCVPSHERTENHFKHLKEMDFWAIWEKGNKKWNFTYDEPPSNYHLLYNRIGQQQLPLWLDFDIVLSQNKFGQFQFLGNIAERLQLPLISFEHTCKMPWWTPQMMDQLKRMRGTANVFITEWSRDNWEWDDDEDTFVIEHTVDSNRFKSDQSKWQDRVLVVANDLIGRNAVLDWDLCKQVTSKFNTKFVGDTKGLSEPAKDTNDLINQYQSSKIFLNTANLSPIPTSLLEAMSCGCVPISVDKCAVSSYIQDGENGLLANDAKGLTECINLVLNDKDLAEKLSNNARKTIQEKCNLDRWIKDWKKVIEYVT